MASDRPVDLANRIALRPDEAAAVLGVSERKLRAMLPRLPHFRDEGVVLIPVDALREHVRDRAQATRERLAATSAEMLERIEKARHR